MTGEKEPRYKWIWSRNVEYSDNRVYGSRLALMCENNLINMSFSFGFGRILANDTKSIKVGFNDGTTKHVKLVSLGSLNGFLIKDFESVEFISYLKDGRGAFKLWIPQKDGTDFEFRFDMSKFPRELRKMQKYCPTMEHRTNGSLLSE